VFGVFIRLTDALSKLEKKKTKREKIMNETSNKY
jgi:hypothetical protein